MDKPLLSRLQRSWLQEIGIDARMLAHFSAEPFAPATAAAVSKTVPEALPDEARRPDSATAAGESGRAPGPVAIAELLRHAPQPPVPAQPSAALAGAHGAGVPDDADLHGLRSHAQQCVACGLHEVRGKVVFGDGVEAAPQWMFVGEAPGEYDDSMGQPFRGRPGDLLRAMLASVGITDASPAYFTNVLKCRPMGNRSPLAEEISACLPLLRQQIKLLRPACLIALGRVSAGALLGRDDELDALRGQVHQYVDEDGHAIPLVVTHHPASLLLHGQLKAEAWRDLNLLPGLSNSVS